MLLVITLWIIDAGNDIKRTTVSSLQFLATFTEFQAAVVPKFNFGDFCFVIFTPSWFFEWKLSGVAQQVLLWAILNEDVQYFSILNLGQVFRVLQILSRHEWNLSKKRGVCRQKKTRNPSKTIESVRWPTKNDMTWWRLHGVFCCNHLSPASQRRRFSPKGPGRQVTFPSEGDEIGSTGKAQVSRPIREWMRNPWFEFFRWIFCYTHKTWGL